MSELDDLKRAFDLPGYIAHRWPESGARPGKPGKIKAAWRGDHSESASLTHGPKGWRWKDFASDGGGSIVDLLMEADGLNKADAIKRAREEAAALGLAIVAAVPAAVPTKTDRWEGWELAGALPDAQLPPPWFKHPKHGQPAAVWTYADAAGAVVFKVARYDLPDGGKDVMPHTVWRGPDGALKWRMKGCQAPRLLYNVPDLHARPDALVLMVEGEKTADVARAKMPGVVAVTWPGGAKGVRHADWSLLAGRDVVMWPDNDEPGRLAAADVARACLAAGAARVRVVEVPEDLPRKWDLADEWPEGLEPMALIEAAPAWSGEVQITDEPETVALADAGGYSVPLRRGENAPSEKKYPESIAAEIVAGHLRDRYRYHYGMDRWMLYQAATGTWSEVPAARVQADTAAAIGVLGVSTKGFTASYVKGVLTLMRGLLGIDEFSDLTGFQNGVLVDGRLVPHSPEHLLIHALPYNYDPAATCEPVLTWLREFAQGDGQVVEVLRCFLHAVVNGRADWQIFLELLGPGGSGKGTFVRLAQCLVGDRAVFATTMKQLEENRFEAAGIRDKRLIQINDADRYGGSVSMLKQITGYDEIRYEAKGKQQGDTFKPSGMVIITVNEPIRSSDYTSGFARRRITIKAENQIDMTQARDLMAEFRPYLSGLYNWVNTIEPEAAKLTLHNAPFAVESIARTREEVEAETNPLAGWAGERLYYAPGERAKMGIARRAPGGGYLDSDAHLYPSYCSWCDDGGASPLSVHRFSPNLIDLLTRQYKLVQIEKKSNGHGTFIYGVTLDPTSRPWGVPQTMSEARAEVRRNRGPLGPFQNQRVPASNRVDKPAGDPWDSWDPLPGVHKKNSEEEGGEPTEGTQNLYGGTCEILPMVPMVPAPRRDSVRGWGPLKIESPQGSPTFGYEVGDL